jgi:heme-degrading monooxygenase HmoA
MILEHCDIQIDPSKQSAFEEAIVRGVETVISKAKGFQGYKVNHSLETPSRYLLLIYWDRLENHTVDFRGSDAFADWRAIVGPFFMKPPVVEHMTLVGKSK